MFPAYEPYSAFFIEIVAGFIAAIGLLRKNDHVLRAGLIAYISVGAAYLVLSITNNANSSAYWRNLVVIAANALIIVASLKKNNVSVKLGIAAAAIVILQYIGSYYWLYDTNRYDLLDYLAISLISLYGIQRLLQAGALCVTGIYMSGRFDKYDKAVLKKTAQRKTAGFSTGDTNSIEQLGYLKDLLEKGIITKDEFDAKVKEIIGS